MSPVRVRSDDWARFSRHIAKLFGGGNTALNVTEKLGPDWEFYPDVNYKYHSLEHQTVRKGDVFELGFKTSLSGALERVRRNAFAIHTINESAIVLLFNTGDACVVELHDADGEPAEIVKSIAENRIASSDLITKSIGALSKIASATGATFRDGETLTHTLIAANNLDEVMEQVASQCFAAEGLNFAPQKTIRDASFTPGWSFSVCTSDAPAEFWDVVAVLIRAQCEWNSARISRDYCLRTLGETDLTLAINALLELERRIVGYQTEFRLWRHRMQEYRANLKPGLTLQADQIEAMWNTRETKDYVNETLAQARNLIQSSYARRLLLQERRQSVMIFLLTSLGVMSVASIAATYWNWLTLANIFEDEAVKTATGALLVKTFLWSLAGLTVALLAWFGISRSRRD